MALRALSVASDFIKATTLHLIASSSPGATANTETKNKAKRYIHQLKINGNVETHFGSVPSSSIN